MNMSGCRVLIAVMAALWLGEGAAAQELLPVNSPDGRTSVYVRVQEGKLVYAVQRDQRELMFPSQLGFTFRGAPPLRDSLRVVSSARNSVDQTWQQPWGEVARVRDHHNELRVSLQERSRL